MEDDYAIGLDLGTHFSCIGVYRKGGVEIIPNSIGEKKSPSVVFFKDKDDILVGEDTIGISLEYSENCIYKVKRLISFYGSEKFQKEIESLPFKVIKSSKDKSLFDIKVKVKGKSYCFSPEEIYALIIKKMVYNANSFLNKKIKKLIITVPAYFNDQQRKMTKMAAEMVGLHVIKILNEPNAAICAYGLTKEKLGNKKIMVFDLGGSNFNISILGYEESFEEKLVILSNVEDPFLGGEDFDNALFNYVLEKQKFSEKIRKNNGIMDRLKNECENIKKILSEFSEAKLKIDDFDNNIDIYMKITRKEFEHICYHLFENIIKLINDVLSKGKIYKSDVGEIILVGGSSKIPKIKEIIENFFYDKIKINDSIDANEVLVYGATIFAEELLYNNKYIKDNSNMFYDKTLFSLGISVQNQSEDHSNKSEREGDEMIIIIKRGNNIPCFNSKYFYTTYDNQTSFSFKIYEGEKRYAKDNHLLREVVLEGLKPKPKGKTKILVEFKIDVCLILYVKAVEVSEQNGKYINIKIKNDGIIFTKEQLNNIKEKANKLSKNIKCLDFGKDIDDDNIKETINILSKLINSHKKKIEKHKDYIEDDDDSDDKDEEVILLLNYNEMLENFIDNFDKDFDNEILLEKYYLYIKELFQSYKKALNLNLERSDTEPIFDKIIKYLSIFRLNGLNYFIELLEIFSSLRNTKRKMKFCRLIISVIKILNDSGRYHIYKMEDELNQYYYDYKYSYYCNYLKYYSLKYFEQSYSYYLNYLKGNEILLAYRDTKILERETNFCFESILDLKSGAIIFSEKLFFKDQLYDRNSEFINSILYLFPQVRNKLNVIHSQDYEKCSVKERLILKEFEKILTQYFSMKKRITENELRCIANIIKINFILGLFTKRKKYLLLIAEIIQFNIKSFSLEKRKWYMEFLDLYHNLKNLEQNENEYHQQSKEINNLDSKIQNFDNSENDNIINIIKDEKIIYNIDKYLYELFNKIRLLNKDIFQVIDSQFEKDKKIFEFKKELYFFACKKCFLIPEIILLDNESLLINCTKCNIITTEKLLNVSDYSSEWITIVDNKSNKNENKQLSIINKTYENNQLLPFIINENSQLKICSLCYIKSSYYCYTCDNEFCESCTNFHKEHDYIKNQGDNISKINGKDSDFKIIEKFLQYINDVQKEKYIFVNRLLINLNNTKEKDEENKDTLNKIFTQMLNLFYEDFKIGHNLIILSRILFITIIHNKIDKQQLEKLKAILKSIVNSFSTKEIEKFKNTINSLKNKYKIIKTKISKEELEEFNNYMAKIFKYNSEKKTIISNFYKEKIFIEKTIGISSFLKKYLIMEKEKNPHNYIDIDKTLNNFFNEKNDINPLENDEFVLSLLGKFIQKNGIQVNICKKKDNIFKNIELISLQSFFSLANYKKYELHFDFGKQENEKILYNPIEKENFLKNWKYKLLNKLNIVEKNFLFTDVHPGCVATHALILDSNPEIEEEILNNLKSINEIIKIDEKPIMEVLQISPDILDKKGNRFANWGINEKRGGEKYIPPVNGWYGIGLKVEGKYDNGNNDWLDYRNNRGEFAIAYIGINNLYNEKDKILEDMNELTDNMENIKNKSYIEDINLRVSSNSIFDKISYIFNGCQPISNQENRCGDGVCVFQNPDYAENSAGFIDVPGYRIKIMLMCRVNPENIRQPSHFPDCWIVNPDEIRPYRILIKKISISSLTEEITQMKLLRTPDNNIINIIKSKEFSNLNIDKNENRFKHIRNIKGQKLNNDDIFVIRLYTSNYYKFINNYLRSNEVLARYSIGQKVYIGFSEEQLKSWICCLQLALSRNKTNVKENTVVYRGIGLRFPNNTGIGYKFFLPEFVSASIKKSMATNWINNKGTLMIITITNNGTNGHPNYCYYVEDFTCHKNEYEVLFSSHCYFTITKIKRGKYLDEINLICEGYLIE